MTTINLYQQSAQENQSDKKNISLSGGFIYSIVMLVLVFAMYGAMILYNSSLEKRNSALQNQVSQQSSSFSGQDAADQVADVQSRLGIISKNIASQPMATDQLHNLAGDMVSGVAVSSYKQEGSKFTVDFLSSNFSDISRQILNLKESKDFTNVAVASLGRGEKNLTLEVTMDAAGAPAAQTTNAN